MIDLEKVISGLHCKAQDLMIDLPACDQCDYQKSYADHRACDFRRLCGDAIALLKEHEAVEPVSDNAMYLQCGNCGGWLLRSDKFCSNCGRAVKRNG